MGGRGRSALRAYVSSTSASSIRIGGVSCGRGCRKNDALYEELYGSWSTTSPEEPTGNVMPRWRRGVLRAVDRVSGCGDEDVEGRTIDDEEAGIRSDGGGGGDDGGPARAAADELERDGGDV